MHLYGRRKVVMIQGVPHIRCTKCKCLKMVNEFHSNGPKRAPRSKCKVCTNRRRRKIYRENQLAKA